MNWILVIVVLIQLKNVSLMSMITQKSRSFQFPDGTQIDQQPGAQDDFSRQGNLTSGIVPALLQPLPGQTLNPQIQPLITTISNLGTNVNGTCICVPTGQCTGNTGVINPSDGSGQLDIRIVTSLLPGVVQPGVITPGIVTPGVTSCQTGLQICCQGGPYQCGVRYPPISGSRQPAVGQAAYGAYPWQAVMLGPGDTYVGSGALVDNFHVLTAAHKVTDYLSGRALKIRLGEWDASSDTEPVRIQEFTVSRIFIHPSYNPNNLKNDIALLRLSVSVPLGQTPTINTACLPATSFSGTRCYVAGWGKNDFSNAGTYQAIQKEVDVPVRTPQECQTSLTATRLGSSFVFDNGSFLCAGGESGKDACTGDGGSPLVCQLGGRWFVAGLVAWGIGCATGGVPGVYVNVATYVPWIQSTVRS